MIITPARFEDEMKRIFDGDYDGNRAREESDQLMRDTLRSMGYDAGIKILESMWR